MRVSIRESPRFTPGVDPALLVVELVVSGVRVLPKSDLEPVVQIFTTSIVKWGISILIIRQFKSFMMLTIKGGPVLRYKKGRAIRYIKGRAIRCKKGPSIT